MTCPRATAGKQWRWECDPRPFDPTTPLYCLSTNISATIISTKIWALRTEDELGTEDMKMKRYALALKDWIPMKGPTRKQIIFCGTKYISVNTAKTRGREGRDDQFL